MDSILTAALEQARTGMEEGGIPIGAALLVGGEVVAVGRNKRIQQGSAILHAEMDALENGGRRSAAFYRRSTMVTTLSPCPMCSGAILLYGIPDVIIGENRTYQGAEDWLREGGTELRVLDSPACKELMDAFIRNNPSLWFEDIGVIDGE